MHTCEHLFCQGRPVARLTVPHHKPETLFCAEHLAEQIKWATPYRDVLGAIVVGAVEEHHE